MTRPVDLNNPEPGFYLVKMAKGGPDVAVRIARLCCCTINGGDDSAEHDWQADCDRHSPLCAWRHGEEVPVDWVWPGAAKRRIDADEYAYRLAIKEHAEQHDPTAPEANPRKAIDHMTTKVMFT